MRHEQLVNHIEGSFLKEQYLEAFLVQSAYVEGLTRLFFDYNYYSKIQSLVQGEKLVGVIQKDISKQSISKLIKILSESNLITETQSRALNTYTDRRNKVIHDLLSEMSKDTFEAELRVVVELGNELVKGKEFNDMVNIVKSIEKNISDKRSQSQVQKTN